MATGKGELEQQFRELWADAYLDMHDGRYAEAEEQFRHLAQLQRRALGIDHEYTLSSQTRQALALSQLERFAEAEAIFREVLQLKQQSPKWGMEHPSTLISVTYLGECLVSQGRWVDAEPMLRKVHGTHIRVLGAGHRNTLRIQATLGTCLAKHSQFEEAERLLRGALKGIQDWAETERTLIPELPMEYQAVASAMVDLAQCLRKAGKLVESESQLRAAVKYSRHRIGEQAPCTIMCMGWHGKALALLGKHAAAEVMYRLALQGSKATFGWEHPRTLASTRSLVHCMLAQLKSEPAAVLVGEAIIHLKQTLGQEHPTVSHWVRELLTPPAWLRLAHEREMVDARLRKLRELARNR